MRPGNLCAAGAGASAPVRLLVLALCCLVSFAAPAEIEVQLSRDKDRYKVQIHTVVAAPLDRVRGVLTDYAHLERLHKSIQESKVLPTADGHPRVRLKTSTCVLFFCVDLKQTLDYHALPNGTLVATVDPAVSDFRYGRMTWTLTAHGPERTSLTYEAEVEPAFWVPPLIGPWVLRTTFSQVSLEITRNIAALAAAATH